MLTLMCHLYWMWSGTCKSPRHLSLVACQLQNSNNAAFINSLDVPNFEAHARIHSSLWQTDTHTMLHNPQVQFDSNCGWLNLIMHRTPLHKVLSVSHKSKTCMSLPWCKKGCVCVCTCDAQSQNKGKGLTLTVCKWEQSSIECHAAQPSGKRLMDRPKSRCRINHFS